jgi:YD repeat-containing protein
MTSSLVRAIAAIALLTMALQSHAVSTRWHFWINFGASPQPLANLWCQHDLGTNAVPTSGLHGDFNELWGFVCENGGWEASVIFEVSCDPNFNGYGTLGKPIGQADADCARKDVGRPCCFAGNPIDPSNANKYEEQVDYAGWGADPIRFVRSYNSRAGHNSAIGQIWRSNLDRAVNLVEKATAAAYVRRADGKMLTFRLTKNGSAVPLTPYDAGAQWTPDADVSDRLIRLEDGLGTTTGWTYYDAATEEFENYDAGGRLAAVRSRSGMVQAISYDGQGRPQAITNSFGRQLTFGYNPDGFINSITDPAGGVYQYSYTPLGYLTSATYPGGAMRQFVYNEPAFTANANLPAALTGIFDELGNRYATFTYDQAGWAIATEHAEGVEKYTVSYSPTTKVTDPLGTVRDYGFNPILGVSRSSGVSQPCAHCGSSNASAIAYDANGNVTSRTDFNGAKMCYAYDSTRNLETARVEGALASESCATVLANLPNRSDVRKTSTQWHGTWRSPTKVGEPNRITSFVYNGDLVNGTAIYCAPSTATVNGNPIGVLCSKSVQQTTDATGQQGLAATATGTARTWTFAYNAFGQVLTATDPKGNTTTTAYYPANDSDIGKRGNISTITNALGHVTVIGAYDSHGRPLSITDPNGLVTTMTYHPRGWITSRTVGGETTSYQYDAAGQLARVIMPDSSYVHYTYDAAHRLTRLQDGLGNKIAYTLDAMGNRLKEEAFDPANQLARARRQVLDSLNRLHQSVGAQ